MTYKKESRVDRRKQYQHRRRKNFCSVPDTPDPGDGLLILSVLASSAPHLLWGASLTGQHCSSPSWNPRNRRRNRTQNRYPNPDAASNLPRRTRDRRSPTRCKDQGSRRKSSSNPLMYSFHCSPQREAWRRPVIPCAVYLDHAVVVSPIGSVPEVEVLLRGELKPQPRFAVFCERVVHPEPCRCKCQGFSAPCGLPHLVRIDECYFLDQRAVRSLIQESAMPDTISVGEDHVDCVHITRSAG